jgi:hypothetical protein
MHLHLNRQVLFPERFTSMSNLLDEVRDLMRTQHYSFRTIAYGEIFLVVE